MIGDYFNCPHLWSRGPDIGDPDHILLTCLHCGITGLRVRGKPNDLGLKKALERQRDEEPYYPEDDPFFDDEDLNDQP